MQRIFNYGDIPNNRFTPDKELNILIYRLPSYLIIYRSHILFKMVRFLAHPIHIANIDVGLLEHILTIFYIVAL